MEGVAALQRASVTAKIQARYQRLKLRDANTYQSILAAIASGSHTWGEIAKMAGVTETGLGSYLDSPKCHTRPTLIRSHTNDC